jgi:hypothetical protein
VEAARRSGGGGHHVGVSLRLRGTGRAEWRGRRRRPTREEALDGAHQGIEGGAGVALAEVGRGEPADEAINSEGTHGLVAETKAGVDIAAHDETPAGNHPAVLVDGEHAGPERSTGAFREDAKVIDILQILCEHDVQTSRRAASWETEKYQTPQASWISFEMRASRMRPLRRHHGGWPCQRPQGAQ